MRGKGLVSEISEYGGGIWFGGNWENYEILVIVKELELICVMLSLGWFWLNCGCWRGEFGMGG